MVSGEDKEIGSALLESKVVRTASPQCSTACKGISFCSPVAFRRSDGMWRVSALRILLRALLAAAFCG